MEMVKLYSPNGAGSIMCHPEKVDEMIANGWSKTKVKQKSKEVKS